MLFDFNNITERIEIILKRKKIDFYVDGNV